MIIKDQSSATWNYYETTTDDGASSSRMSHLHPDPDRDADPHRPPSPPQSHSIHTTPSAARRRLGITALASTLFVVAMSAGLATFFLLFVILSQVPNVSDPAAFVVRERSMSSDTLESSSLSALSISTAISHFLSITTPVVLSLLAYRTAYLWMQAQSSPSADEEGVASRLPTPLHYGLLMRILNSSNILNLGPLMAYFLPHLGRRASAANTTPITTPRLLREAFAGAFVVYLLSHAVGLADIWLHASSSVALAEAVTPATTLPDFSLVFNDTLCDSSTGTQCMSYSDHWGTPEVTRTGALVAANSTVPTEISVVTLADANDTAILVPTDLVREWNFSASTYGARAQCFIIGSYCADDGCPGGYLPGPAVDVGMSTSSLQVPKTSSSKKVVPRGSSFHDYRDLSRVMAYVGNLTVGSPTGMPASVADALPPNPGPVLVKLRWTDFESTQSSFGRHTDDTGLILYPSTVTDKGDDEFQSRTVTTLYTQCELEFVKVRYGYNPYNQFVAYNIKGMDDDASMAAVFWSPLIWQQITPQFESNMHQECLGESSAQSILAMLGQELSRLAIAGASGTLMRTEDQVSDASKITQLLVGRYPRIPVFVFAGLLYAYAALAVILFLATTACTSDVIIPQSDEASKEKYTNGEKPPKTYTALELAQRRLVDPATLIAEQYVWAPHTSPAQASEMSSRTRTAEIFGVNQPVHVHEGKAAMGPDRLVVGMGGPYADTGNPRFGVWRRPKRQVEAEPEHEPEMQAGYGRGAPSSIGSGDIELLEGTTLVGSTIRQRDQDRLGMPPAYTSLSRGARSRSDGSEFTPEYLVRHGPGSGLLDTHRRAESVRVDLGPQGRRRVVPEKDLTELMRIRSSVSSEGSEASASTGRTVRRSTGI